MDRKMRDCKDSSFLTWLRDRLTNVYKESPNADFVRRLEKIISEVKHMEDIVVPELKQMHDDLVQITKDLKDAQRS